MSIRLGTFLNIFLHCMLVVYGIAPIKTVRLKHRSDPWMVNEILLAIRDRDNALKNFRN